MWIFGVSGKRFRQLTENREAGLGESPTFRWRVFRWRNFPWRVQIQNKYIAAIISNLSLKNTDPLHGHIMNKISMLYVLHIEWF